MEYSYKSQYQFALAVLLRRNFPFQIKKIEAFDPMFSVRDTLVMEAWGCDVLRENELCRGLAVKPTIFYMPFPDAFLLWNLFNVNWCPSHLNQMVVLSNPLEAYGVVSISKPLKVLLVAI